MEHATQPLTEAAPDEAVVRALVQSAYPAEFAASNKSDDAERRD